MDMIQEFREEIEEVMENMDCPKDFTCYKNNFEGLCAVKDLGIEDFVECDCESCNYTPTTCPFGFDFGYSYFCSCPLRVFVAKKLMR